MDLFGEEEDEAADTFKAAPVPATNGFDESIEEKDLSSSLNGVALGLEQEREGNGCGAEKEESKELGPRDNIEVSVVRYQKAADDFTYDIELEVNGKKKTIHRKYKELLWLHRNLLRRVELGGNILPPMPSPPPKTIDAKISILGRETKSLFGDYNRLPCLAVERFLQSLANHRYFSENNTIHTYLTQDQVGMEESLGPGNLWMSITKAISDMQKSSVQDPEEEFPKFLRRIEELTPRLQEAAKTFNCVVESQQSVAVSEFLLAEMLRNHSNWCKEKNEGCSVVVGKLAGGIEEEKNYFLASSFDGRHTLGFTFELYHLYCTQAKEMLYRRLAKLQALLQCNSQLDKAKPEKKASAEAAKKEADRTFQTISETAKREIELHSEQYVADMKANLLAYAESQIQLSRQTHSSLSKLCDELSNSLD